MKTVTIKSYDPTKGKGVYHDQESGQDHVFSYHAFEGERMISAGQRAELTKDFKLRIPREGWLKSWVRRVLRWR